MNMSLSVFRLLIPILSILFLIFLFYIMRIKRSYKKKLLELSTNSPGCLITDFNVGDEVKTLVNNGNKDLLVCGILREDNLIKVIDKDNTVFLILPNLIRPKSYRSPSIYVDLDGVLAFYDGWQGYDHIGKPIPVMIKRVKGWVSRGHNVKIFTSRCENPEAIPFIKSWITLHIGIDLEITNIKGLDCVVIWDDRAIRVIPNTGNPCCKLG